MGDVFSANHMMRVLEKSLEGLSRRHDALTNNIANVDTPHYNRKDVNFRDTLKQVIKEDTSRVNLHTTDPGHIGLSVQRNGPSFSIEAVNDTAYRNDRNNVDIEKEIVEINKNSLLYNAATDMLNNEFFLLRYAIEEGRR
ncbi:MAG: flagellar basal body rod protein FlgB [Candidatus Omnitrophica bacterium]|nr:flagellar basal body rod protein FlgB [Candidatus Omnitrophota bacterium]